METASEHLGDRDPEQLKESAPLLIPTAAGSPPEQPSTTGGRRRIALWSSLVGLCALAGLGLVARGNKSSAETRLEAAASPSAVASPRSGSAENDIESSSPSTDDFNDDMIDEDWGVVKYTIAVSKGTGSIWQQTMQSLHLLGGMGGDILGCDSLRHYGNMGEVDGKVLQLHTVESPRMDTSDPSIAQWQEIFQSTHGDMSEYDVFMDNRVAMFTTRLQTYLDRLKSQGINHMKRLSGASSEFAHVLFQVSGNVYELVGPYDDLDESNKYGWESWASDECSEAQTLPHSLDYYREMHSQSKTGLPMPVSFGVAMTTWAYNQKHTFLEFSEKFSSAKVATHVYESCTHIEMYWPLTPTLRINLVNNHGHSEGQDLLRTYEDSAVVMIEDLPDDGTGWTHFLDLHIGILKADDNSKDCQSTADAMVKYAVEHSENIHFGGRWGGSTNMHFYAGFKSFMTYEWNVPCTVPFDISFCACVSTNNDHDFFTKFGYSCPHFGDGI